MPDDLNPYQAPEAALSHSTVIEGQDRIDVTEALTEAWNATWANFPLWLGVGIVYMLSLMASAITIVGIFLLAPVIFWGLAYVSLRMFDGRGELGDLFAGFRSYGEALLGMLALMALGGLVYVPVAMIPLFLIGSVDQLTATAIQYLLQFGVGAVLVRLQFVWFLLVERGLGPIEAIAASWTGTEGSWLKLIGILLLTYAISIAGFMLLLVGIIPASVLTGFLYVAAYRQLFGSVRSSDD